MTELELKFGIPDAALAGLRDAMLLHGAQTIHLQARYVDTAHGDLARHQMALRLRREGHAWVQTVKAAGQGVAHRLEHEVAVPGDGDTVPQLVVSRHADTAAGDALAALLAQTASPLIDRYATDVVRLRCWLQDAQGTQMEAALDVGSASAGARSTPILELELEHKGGPVAGLFDLARAWVLHGGLWLSTVSKAERGERLLHADTTDDTTAGIQPRVVRASAPRIGRHADGQAVMQALLQSALAQVLANASDVAAGSMAADSIHQLRIGLRRLRTVLRELATLTRAVPAEWEPALASAFRQLGVLRDAQAAPDAVRALLQAAGAPMLALPGGTRVDAPAVVRDPALQSTLVAILGLAHADADAFVAHSPTQVRALVAARLKKLHRSLARQAKRFAHLPLPAQHRVRKRIKRLRYLADMTADLWPKAPLRRYLKTLSAAQEALGQHTDVAVAAAAFRKHAATQAEAWFGAGFLQAHLGVTARAAQKTLVTAAAATPFWA